MAWTRPAFRSAFRATRALTNRVKFGMTLLVGVLLFYALSAIAVLAVGDAFDVLNHTDGTFRDSFLLIYSALFIFSVVGVIWFRGGNALTTGVVLHSTSPADSAWKMPLNFVLAIFVIMFILFGIYFLLPVEEHLLWTGFGLMMYCGWITASILAGHTKFDWYKWTATPMKYAIAIPFAILIASAVAKGFGFDLKKAGHSIASGIKDGRKYANAKGRSYSGTNAGGAISTPAAAPATLVSTERVGLLRSSEVFPHGDNFSRVVFAGTEENGVDSKVCLNPDEEATVTHKSGSVLVNPANGFFVPVWGIPHADTDPYYDQRMMSPTVPSNGIAAIVGQDTVAFQNGQHEITVKNQSSSGCEPVVIWINESAGDSYDNMGNLVLEIRK